MTSGALPCPPDSAGRRLYSLLEISELNNLGNGRSWRERLNARLPRGASVAQVPPVSLAHRLETEIVATRRFRYVRVGYDERLIELLPDHRIGRGLGHLERDWYVNAQGELVLVGEATVTCRLSLNPDGTWHGRWLHHERMPIALIPARPRDALQPAPGSDPPVEPIDAVYTWVDGADPDFQASLARYRGQAIESDAGGASRFRDGGQLRYSLRSLERFAPWLRRIYLVTNGQVPPWLVPAHPRLTLVTHQAIFPDSGDLPTFNSHAIELHLHRIPGLARRFLYFNDDVFLGAPLAAADFIDPDGRQQVYLEPWPAAPRPAAAQSAYDQAMLATRYLLDRRLSPSDSRLAIAHTPQLYDREVVETVQAEWPAAVRATSAHRFRASDDVVWRLLYYHYALTMSPAGVTFAARTLHSGSRDYIFVQLDGHRDRAAAAFDNIDLQHPRFFCLNDDLDDSDASEWILHDRHTFLDHTFPAPSSFERS